MTVGKEVNIMVNSTPHASFHLLLRVKCTTLALGITVLMGFFLGVLSIQMTTINITEARTELSLMASKRNFTEFVMTLLAAIFQQDVSFRLHSGAKCLVRVVFGWKPD